MTRRESARELGRRGEDWVRRLLEKRGFTILERNWSCPWGEIDLIAATERELLFIEVKTRSGAAFAAAKEAVGPAKRRRLWRSAECYLAEHPEERRQPRFDVAEVYAPQGLETHRPVLHYIENAFDGDDEIEDSAF